MREVIVSPTANQKVMDLLEYLDVQFKMSEGAVGKYADRIGLFLNSLRNDADYALCRFEKWRKLGYHCVVFEKNWIFAYERVGDEIRIRDMRNASAMKN